MTRTSSRTASSGRPAAVDQGASWSPGTRLAFRFTAVYLTLFALATQISGSLIANLWFTYRGLGRLWPMREVTHWVAQTLFGIDVPLDDVSGGETLFFWIQWSWVIVASVLAAAIWTALARRRTSYASMVPWALLLVRVAVAASLIEYGMTKVIPTQFPAPPLATLVTPVGELTTSALLWTTIGSATAYQVATGVVELLAGVLLLVPRTVTLGAILAVASLAHVLLLNLTFDIGVKLVTAHLVAMGLILLAPDWRRMRAAVRLTPSTGESVRRDGMWRPASAGVRLALVVIGLYLVGMQAYMNWSFWNVAGGGQPRPALYGIWNVERLAVDGQVRPAELNDYDRRWRRVIFDTVGTLQIQRIDDSLARYGVTIDTADGTLALRKGNSRTWSSRFAFDRTGDDRLTLAGVMDGRRVVAELRRVDESAFPLLNSGFRWIRPHD